MTFGDVIIDMVVHLFWTRGSTVKMTVNSPEILVVYGYRYMARRLCPRVSTFPIAEKRQDKVKLLGLERYWWLLSSKYFLTKNMHASMLFIFRISAFRLGYSLLILRSKNFYGDCLLTGETFLFWRQSTLTSLMVIQTCLKRLQIW